MMKKKNLILFAVIVLLVLTNLIFNFLPEGGSKVSFNERMFAVRDTSALNEIKIIKNGVSLLLSREDAGWELNGKYAVDEGLKNLLINILQRVNVKRPVKLDFQDSILVEIDGESFSVSGNATKTKTYFSKDGQSFEVEIPGYKDYLARIFELNLDQWRNRLVYNGSWRTIQSLKLSYSEDFQSDFEIRFLDKFFAVQGVISLDSSMVVDYLNQFQYLQTNERISLGRFSKYDSLAKTTPVAKLTIESINYSAPEVFTIFPSLNNERFHLVKNKTGEMMIFDKPRISRILLKKQDFILK